MVARFQLLESSPSSRQVSKIELSFVEISFFVSQETRGRKLLGPIDLFVSSDVTFFKFEFCGGAKYI